MMLPTLALAMMAVALVDDPPKARPTEPSAEYAKALRTTREHQARQRALAARRKAASRVSTGGALAGGGNGPDPTPTPSAPTVLFNAPSDGHLHSLAHLPYMPGLGLAGIVLTAPGCG